MLNSIENFSNSELYFEYHCIDQWPPLAWFAQCSKENKKIVVWHGNNVEINREWFCEAVWPDSFLEGNFDKTDLVAGTGARIRENTIVFVSPGNTVDRILSIEVKDKLLVSNSLACLLAVSGAEVDITYSDYYGDFTTIVKGISEYKKIIKTSMGDLQITMFGYIVWNQLEISYLIRKITNRDFHSFNEYEQFLQLNFNKLFENMSDKGRIKKYQPLSTISSGYDSTAISALAKQAGCKDALCIDTDRYGNLENGDRVASYLNLNPIQIKRDAWLHLNGEELYFLAADATAEAVFMAGAGELLTNRVLFTGYHGDKLWSKDTKDLSENIVRGDSSGLSLTEYRLWKSFIHCPITFWGVQQICSINQISNSEEMKPWDIPGDYSRPIPRRIAESMGVPRDVFGITKKASAIGSTEFLSQNSLKDYRTWLSSNCREWLKRGRLPPITNRNFERLTEKLFYFFQYLLLRTPYLWRLVPDNSLDRPSGMRRYVFTWAVNKVKELYRIQLTNSNAESLRKNKIDF